MYIGNFYKSEDLRGANNKYRTLSLFYEWKDINDHIDPIFTIGPRDIEFEGRTLPSLRRIYVDYEDPSEYTFAMDVFGDWDHWQAIANSKGLKKEVDKWRQELEAKLLSKSLKTMIETAQKEGSKGTTAAKYLADRAWKKNNNNNKRGRPSKEEVEREKKIQAKADKELGSDIALFEQYKSRGK